MPALQKPPPPSPEQLREQMEEELRARDQQLRVEWEEAATHVKPGAEPPSASAERAPSTADAYLAEQVAETERALAATADAMQQECVAFRWQRGDLLVIDNALVMHSRRPFTGPRRILASIASG